MGKSKPKPKHNKKKSGKVSSLTPPSSGPLGLSPDSVCSGSSFESILAELIQINNLRLLKEAISACPGAPELPTVSACAKGFTIMDVFEFSDLVSALNSPAPPLSAPFVGLSPSPPTPLPSHAPSTQSPYRGLCVGI